MLEISRSSNAYLLVPIDPLDELGAPADPSELDVELGFSASARLTPEQWHTGDWQVDDSEPTVRYFARILHGPDAPAPVQLDEGEWWIWARPDASPEAPALRAEQPIRVLP